MKRIWKFIKNVFRMLRIRLFGKKPVYTVTVNLYKNSTSYPLTGTQPTVTLNGVSRTAVGGVVTFTDVEDGSYMIQVGSTAFTSSYSESLTVAGTNKTVGLTLTGTYQVKAEFINSDGGYINALSVYLRTSGGSNLDNGTTNTGGDVTFSSSVKIAYGTSYKLYVPEQVISGMKYNATTFTLSTSNSSDLGGDMVYWRQNRIVYAPNTFTITIQLTKDGYTLSGTKPAVTLNGSTQTVDGSGRAVFSGIAPGTYTVNVGATTYNYSLSTSITVSSSMTKTINVSGKYSVKAEFVNASGDYVGGLSVQLRNSSGYTLTSGTTNGGGDVVFSSSYLFDANSSYDLYVPSQTIGNVKYYSKTFVKRNSDISLGGDQVYWRSNALSSASAGGNTETLLLDCPFTYGKSYTSNLVNNKRHDGAYGNPIFAYMQDGITTESGEAGLIYDLGAVYDFKAYKWSLSYEILCNSNNAPNVGVRIGTSGATASAYSAFGLNSFYSNGITLLSSTSGSSWSKIHSLGYYNSTGRYISENIWSEAGSNVVNYNGVDSVTMDMGAIGRYLSVITDAGCLIKNVKFKMWL